MLGRRLAVATQSASPLSQIYKVRKETTAIRYFPIPHLRQLATYPPRLQLVSVDRQDRSAIHAK